MNRIQIKNLISQIENNFQDFYSLLSPLLENHKKLNKKQLKHLSKYLGLVNFYESEMIEYCLQKILNEEHPYITDINLKRIQSKVDFQDFSLEDRIDIFFQQRQKLIQMLNTATLEQWDRTGVLSEEGHVTFFQLMERFLKKSKHIFDYIQKSLT